MSTKEYKPGGKSVGFPHPNPTLPFWLQGTHTSPLLGHRTTHALPASADVVVIGSGMSGAATSYFMMTDPNAPKNVLMLEAREACSGATARNGGHCRPDCYRGYTAYKAAFGKEQAFKILANEMDTLNLVQEIIEKESIDCDFWRGHSIDVAMDQECADAWFATLQEYILDGGKVDGIVEWIADTEKAKKITRCPSAIATAIFPAGSLWPYKFVLALLQICLNKHGLNLQTKTPVKAVTSALDGTWRVETDRGIVTAQKVVYATNAFTSTLLPEFYGKITPFRGQCSAVVPMKPYTGSGALTHTYVFKWGPPRVEKDSQISWIGDYDYLIQRPKDGIIIIGGGRWKVPITELLGQTDDSAKLPAITEHFKTALGGYFEGWGQGAVGEGLLCDWTGIMACSRELAALIRGENWTTTNLSECFEPTPERLSSSRKTVEEIWLKTHSTEPDVLH